MKMRSRPSMLTLVSIYAIVATIALSHRFVQDISLQLKQTNEIDDVAFYEKHFLPAKSYHNVSLPSRATAAIAPPSASDEDVGHSTPAFPIKTHIVTQGHPRTATTLLFNMVAVSYFLYLVENDPQTIPDVELIYWQRTKGYKVLRSRDTPMVAKAHITLDNFLSDNTVVFTAAKDKKEAAEMKRTLTRDGHTIAFVQDMETLKEGGVSGLVDEYVAGYGLSEKDRANLNDYFASWEVLRQCCGQQMSAKWRNDMVPEQFKTKKFKSHPTCKNYDIDKIEQDFMKTELYSLIEKYPSVQPLNKPSMNDGNLNGTYCSSYNYLVRTQGLSIWGVPGGRPTRSKIDGAIKEQVKLARNGLKPEGFYLFPKTDKPLKVRYKEMWDKPDAEKKEWLRNVLSFRIGGKSYEDYKISPSSDTDEVTEDVDDDEMDEGYDSDIENEDGNLEEEEEEEDDDNAVEATASIEEHQSEDEEKDLSTIESSGKNDITEFDDSHAIFLISFGEEAAESTLVERCILSLRRRGAWDGYIVLLTDAPPERYENEWDDNVIVMHPREEHLNAADGTPLKYTKENTSLKPKRFKTFITEYMSMDKRLDSVDLIYYLDIDIMAGDSMANLFREIENKYEVSTQKRNGGRSRLYFFTPLSKEWPVQGGTFIVERKSSGRCLELWRNEIDKLTISGRGRDQDALRTIHDRIRSGKEDYCELVRMENENYISFPTPRTFDKLIRQSSYPNLVHISNSVFAKRIDEEAQTEYIQKVLQLSEEEKQSGKYGKSIVHAKKSDM